MGGRFFQNVHVVNALPAASAAAYDDLFNGTPATDIINLGKYENATFIIQKAAGATGTATITVESCDTVVPGTATAIPFVYWVCTTGDTWGDMQTATASGFTTTAGTDQVYAVEVNSASLSGTNKYVRVKATEVVNSPVSGSITCLLSKGRVVQEVSPTAIV